jgi:serine/threonine protein kinase
MESPLSPDLDPANLPPGTKVGPWRVVSRGAQGTYGTVYRAVSSGQDEPVPVALKLARHPEDPRFSREATLLSRLDHPRVPLLLDHGRWRHSSGAPYPYLTMAWIEGTPLYDWARKHNPTSHQVLQLLSHLTRALQAVHKASAVHRDVKGDNVLVRHEDSRAVLTDFGSSNHRGAFRLTWRTQPPGTPAYRSPEAWRFLLRFGLASDAHYLATPADDVFALGVTAYRFVTGQYPPSTEPGQPEADAWDPEGSGPKPPHALNPRVDPRLSALILRMLSAAPEHRGSAKELAEALESAAAHPVPEAEQPLFERVPTPPPDNAEATPVPARPPEPATVRKASTEVPRSQAESLFWVPWLATTGVGLILAFWAGLAMSTRLERIHSTAPMASTAEQPDAGTAAVGNEASPTEPSSSQQPSGKEPVAGQYQRQAEPDSKGRCPDSGNVVRNGSCWVVLPMNAETCERNGYVYEQDKCYAPVFSNQPQRRPTSSPSNPQ